MLLSLLLQHDGHLLAKRGTEENNSKGKENAALRAARSCSQYALTECPSLLEFMGYAFCFSNVLVGPAFEFSQYRSACDGSLHYKNAKDGTRQLRGKSIPNNILPTLIPFIKAFLLIIFASVFDRAFNYRRLLQPWYYRLATRHRFFVNWMTNFVQRQKVYCIWLFAEGSNNIW
jgi:lysophospholipid acyltransferase